MRILGKTLLSTCVGALALVLALACGGGGGGTPSSGNPFPVTVSVSPASATVACGATYQFTATVTGGTLDTAVIWSVQETGGGTVNTSGLYTAPLSVDATSTFHVVATSHADTTKSATATVTVQPVTISITPSPITLPSGGTQSFAATVSNASNTAVTWLVSPGGGSVVPSGTSGPTSTATYTAPVVTASSTFYVTAISQADSNKVVTATVTVEPVSIRINPDKVTLGIGNYQKFTAIVTGISNPAVKWSVQEGPSGGIVDTSGNYMAPAVSDTSTFHVIATSVDDSTKSATAIVTVITGTVPVSVSVAPTPVTLPSGGTQTFAATVTGSSNITVTWSVQEGPSGGSVNTSSGVYIAPSVSTISTFHVIATSAADNTKSAMATVTVNPTSMPVLVIISPTPVSIPSGSTQPFTVTVTGTSNPAVTWSVQEGSPAGGSVNTSGVYTAPSVSANSTFHVIATSVADPTKSAMATVTVTPVTITIAPTSATIPSRSTQSFTATVTGTGNTAVTWVVSETGGGSVTTSGLYTAPSVSTTSTYHVVAISLADSNKSATATVTVTPIGISINPTTASVNQGATKQFTAPVTGTSNTAVNWTVQEGPAGGSVSTSGLYIAPSTAGTFHVVATSVADPSKSATATVTVPIVAITISPVSATLDQGETKQFTATVTGTTNTAATWKVSVGGGSIDPDNGFYTAPDKAGTYFITATSNADNTKVATATVTVRNVTMVISPTTVTVAPGATQQFAATVTGTKHPAVAWAVSGGGSINSTSGLYTAPTTPGMYSITITVTLIADPTNTVSITVTVTVQDIVITVSPNPATVDQVDTKQFAATVTGITNKAVTWTCNDGTLSGHAITPDGGVVTWRAPTTAGPYWVKATSDADTSKYGTANITVPNIVITISPVTKTLLSGDLPFSFTANVTGTVYKTTTWTIQGPNAVGTVVASGAFDNTGNYTPPLSVDGQKNFAVRAAITADSTKFAEAPVTVNPNVYAGGYRIDSTNVSIPGYWKNGAWVGLSTLSGAVNSMVVTDSDIYAGGNCNNGSGVQIPGYWKTFNWWSLSTGWGDVSSMAVSGNDVVYATWGGYGGYSKNGTWVPLGGVVGDVGVTSLAVSGNDVYAGGTVSNLYNGDCIKYDPSGEECIEWEILGDISAAYWKNGSYGKTLCSTEFPNSFGVSSMFVSGSNVYAGGHSRVRHPDHPPYSWLNTPAYWKHNTISDAVTGTDLPLLVANKDGYVSSLVASGTDVYVGGYCKNGSDVFVPGYWKHNTITDVKTWVELPRLDASKSGYVSSLVLSGTDVYAGGYCISSSNVSVPGYWKHNTTTGEKTWVPLPVIDSNKNATVNSLVVR